MIAFIYITYFLSIHGIEATKDASEEENRKVWLRAREIFISPKERRENWESTYRKVKISSFTIESILM